ncbi:MAG TPA: hypothetical protein VEC57_15785 [Candidatus Limnocylindrales bacterium]|nr:hypothetical protein [Candidatus Limnocylindrales bacterium]
MKAATLLLAVVTLVLGNSDTANAGKRLTTGSSGLADGVECTVINVSEDKPAIVEIKVRNAFGFVVAQQPAQEILPGSRGLLAFNATDLWCEFVVISGSSKQLRASSVMYDGSLMVNTEVAREK